VSRRLTIKEWDVEIESEDYATLEKELDGSRMGTVGVRRVGPPTLAINVRRREIVRCGRRTSLWRWVLKYVSWRAASALIDESKGASMSL